MLRVFQPASFGPLQMPNRFVRSATWDNMADQLGNVTEESIQLFSNLADGGMGLIVTGYTFVARAGQSNPGQYGIHRDEMIPGLARLVRAVHDRNAKIAVQISHCGGKSRYLMAERQIALAPTEIGGGQPQREMNEEDIETVLSDFGAAATRAKEAGFDAVQLHAAHGLVFSQFLSPVTNHRTDRWGGSGANRHRFHTEVIRRVRVAVGPGFPILIKFGVMDDVEGGTTVQEGVAALIAMIAAGLDGVEISGGLTPVKQPPVRVFSDACDEIPYYRERAAAVKRLVGLPLALVGGIRCLETAEEIIGSGDADFISLSRPFIREPGLVKRWQRGDRQRASCATCAKCVTACGRGYPLACRRTETLVARRNRSNL